MRLYLLPVMGMCFAVDGLLLLGAGRIGGKVICWQGVLLASGLGAVHAGACMIPAAAFLGGLFCRLAVLVLMGMVAYGDVRQTLRFVVLDMAAGGLSAALGGENTALPAAIVLLLLCRITFSDNTGEGGILPVVLEWNGRIERFAALRDTGNRLKDPLTGAQVIVVSAQVAGRIFGLTQQQICAPMETMLSRPFPGLRLIPYQSVGGQGILLGLAMDNVQIGKKSGRAVLAFAPTGLDGKQPFQALTGGAV